MWRSATHSPDDEQYPRPRSQYIGELVWQVGGFLLKEKWGVYKQNG